jgi:hypothetical protein
MTARDPDEYTIVIPKERRRLTNVLDLRPQPPAQAPEPEPRPAPRPTRPVAPTRRAPQPAPVQRTPAVPIQRTHSQPARPAPARPAPARPSPKAQPATKKRRRLTPRALAVHALKVVSVLIGTGIFLSLNDVPLPERLIGIYLVVSLVYAFDSQRTFIVALIFLAMVAVASAIGQSVPAESYAVYAFYFLVIGLIAAIREQIGLRARSVSANSQLSGD